MIAIIDSGGANIASVMFALERCGANGTLTADPDVIMSADKVILPGVGAAPVAMDRLRQAGLLDCICSLKQPVLASVLGCNCCLTSRKKAQHRFLVLSRRASMRSMRQAA